MIEALIFWARRLWPFVTLGALFIAAFAVTRSCAAPDPMPAFSKAQQATAVAEQLVAVTETTYVQDTVRRTVGVTAYRVARDTLLLHLTDTVQVKHVIAAADNALLLDSTALASCARAIRAHIVLESSLRTELAAALRLSAPRFTLTSYAGADVASAKPVTGLESSVRLSEHWSAVARVEQVWAPGEPTRRFLLARYTF